MGDTHVGLQARLMSQALRKADRRNQENQLHRYFHQSAA
jgi:RecA/RadA recombinase